MNYSTPASKFALAYKQQRGRGHLSPIKSKYSKAETQQSGKLTGKGANLHTVIDLEEIVYFK